MRIKIFAAALLTALFVTAAAAEPVTLKDSAVVSGDAIRLGDIFANAGPRADAVVAYAPEPGKRAVFDATWLYRIARYFGLEWRPLGTRDRIVIARDSHMIGSEEIADHVLSALVEQGANPEMEVNFSSRDVRLYVDSTADAMVGVEYASYDARSRRFSAMISAPAGDPAAQRLRVTGRLYEMREVPVPAHRISARQVIGKNDVKWIKMRTDRLRRDAIVDMDNLIGMSPRRSLRAGVQVHQSEVRRPLMVEKNSLVTILLQTSAMTLTAKGKALESGSEGDIVRISNTQSKNVIDAEVTGPNTVVVRTDHALAMN